jgi:hypothetical protein
VTYDFLASEEAFEDFIEAFEQGTLPRRFGLTRRIWRWGPGT